MAMGDDSIEILITWGNISVIVLERERSGYHIYSTFSSKQTKCLILSLVNTA